MRPPRMKTRQEVNKTMDPTSKATAADRLPLTTVVSEVLGDLAFMIADDAAEELPAGSIWLEGRVSYRGPERGTLRLWCTREFATRLAANLLGLEPDEGEAQIGADDALRELMNVLCGQLVTTWHGTEQVFHLSIPTVVECSEPPTMADVAEHARCRLFVEDEPLLCLCQRED